MAYRARTLEVTGCEASKFLFIALVGVTSEACCSASLFVGLADTIVHDPVDLATGVIRRSANDNVTNEGSVIPMATLTI